jgi:hypothetical protein
LSFDTSGSIGGVDFADEDVLQYDGGAESWSIEPGLATPPAARSSSDSSASFHGQHCDVIADYWPRAFASLGREDTFRLFQAKYELLLEQDGIEAKAALAGFRRLCRLRGRAGAFNEFWTRSGS